MPNDPTNYEMNEAHLRRQQHPEVRRTCLTSIELELAGITSFQEHRIAPVSQSDEGRGSVDMSVVNGNGEGPAHCGLK